MVRRCGIGAELLKCDVKSDFCILPVHPQNFDLLSFHFQVFYYIDRALSMACSISCMTFEHFSLFLEWKLRCRVGCKNTVHSLDDYLFCGEGNTGRCKFILEVFQPMVSELGLPLAKEKTEGPATSLTSLGIELDTTQQTSRLSDSKLRDLKVWISLILRKRKMSLRELRKTVGHPNFVWRVVVPSHA